MKVICSKGDGREAFLPVKEGEWLTRMNGAAVFRFSTPQAEWVMEPGDRVQCRNGEETLFDGFVFQTERGIREQEAVCYDRVKYLLYRDTRIFQNRTAGEITAEILAERMLKMESAETGYVLPLLIMEERPLLEMIRRAISETKAASGREYFLADRQGILSLREAGAEAAGVLLSGGNQILSFRERRDIDGDTFNRFQIRQEDRRRGFRRITVLDDTESQRKWGVLQYAERIDSRLNPAQAAARLQALHRKKCRERKGLEIEAWSESSCCAGRSVMVRLRKGETAERYLICEAEHRFSGGSGRMRLVLRKMEEER